MSQDVIIIGSGINSLVCGALLAKKGKKVALFERSEKLGGCIQSEFVEGCVIDTFSTAYPLFVTSGAYPILKEDLENEGVHFVSNKVPTGVLTSDLQWSILSTDRKTNIDAFNQLHPGDGDRYNEQMDWVNQHAEILFTILGGELRTFKMGRFLAKYVWKQGVGKASENAQEFLKSVRTDLPDHFSSKALLANLAPWVLHSGLSPESPLSSTMAKVTAMSIEMVGLPLVKGGSYKIVEALKSIIEKNGGTCYTNSHVEKILTDHKGNAEGIELANKEVHLARHVIANVTPTQLYGSLLKGQSQISQKIEVQANQYKYGKGNMQIHLILNERPEWVQPALQDVTYVHLTDGIDDVSRAVNEATRQHLPAKGTICIAQPTAVDPSRASDGKYILWILLPECPNYPVSDAAGELNELCQGSWTKELNEAYSNRILDCISTYIPNLKRAIIYKRVISPKELSEININLEHGDPYSGQCNLDQYLIWRPMSGVKNHETPIKNLFHIGASTHPGPGLSGGSGFLVSQKIK
ncbi:NAD(P)/FAD-dependent oxidoreductase [Sphingobacterium daejeonense]|uniref:phytoene desaturase family protein n=1 Tax=Sphingobacterium daejeonense TaxID=371142 RepID=UPI0021A80127|nr:NAD(P)/FAD-dependent oxidoreductase [Sphingobacterium daejeonense]MCT1531921.1 NAD(P)/FAD-dependent oxidoreductase [Sphingobacterium daejeonense]